MKVTKYALAWTFLFAFWMLVSCSTLLLGERFFGLVVSHDARSGFFFVSVILGGFIAAIAASEI